MVTQEKTYTIEEFLEIVQLPENENRRLELVNGEIIEVAPSRGINGYIAGKFIRLIGNYAEERDLGYMFTPDVGFQLGPNTMRQPDAAFIAKSRNPDFQSLPFPFPPDIAIEVISPSETPRMVIDKTNLYLTAGTPLVLNVYPDEKIVDVCRLAADGSLNITTLQEDDTLDGGDVLPGFTLPVRDIFPK